MLISFLVIMGLLFADGWIVTGVLNRYYDLYAARVGGVPTRRERREVMQKAFERYPNPQSMFRYIFHRQQWEPLVWLYTIASDELVEARRRGAQVAFAALLAWPILAIPISQLIYSVVSGLPLPPGWLWFTVLRSTSLVVFFSWAIRLGLALLARNSPPRWRLTCVAGMVIALIFFFLFIAIA